jgi:hypothetical protein
LIIIVIIYAFSFRNPFSREKNATPTIVVPATAPLSSATSHSMASLAGPLPVAHKQRNLEPKENSLPEDHLQRDIEPKKSSPAAMPAKASVVAEPAKTLQRHKASVMVDAGSSQPIRNVNSRPVNVRDQAIPPSLVHTHPLAALLRDRSAPFSRAFSPGHPVHSLFVFISSPCSSATLVQITDVALTLNPVPLPPHAFRLCF